MDRNNESIDVAVDELLAAVEVPTVDSERGEITGVYDVSFFQSHQIPPVERRRSGYESMEDARVGLGLFLDEAEQALTSPDLTVDQRLHVATIVSYIDGLAKRFDHVRTPGFVQKKR